MKSDVGPPKPHYDSPSSSSHSSVSVAPHARLYLITDGHRVQRRPKPTPHPAPRSAHRPRVDRPPSDSAPPLMVEDEWDLPVRQRQNSPHDAHLYGSSPRPSSRPADPLADFRRRREWPPRGYTFEDTLDPIQAEDLVCAGASTFAGECRQAPGAPPDHYRFFAIKEDEHAESNDRAEAPHVAFEDCSMTIFGPAEFPFPWTSLEQPCMAYAFGKYPGTTTLNFRIGQAGTLKTILKYDTDAKPKKLKILHTLDRLRSLESGFDSDNPDELARVLYSMLLERPTDYEEPRGLEMQISDLITVLSNSHEWVDFSLPKNQVVAKFFDSKDPSRKHKFFHQLLLSMELYLRVHHDTHEEMAKEHLFKALPPKILWDLAVAQKWLQCMSITKVKTSSKESHFGFELQMKKRQREALRRFAQLLKWPGLDEVNYILDEKGRGEVAVEERSADAMTWFTGVVLPGPTLPWLLMNSLIDCDKGTGPPLKYLTHVVPASGFQYKSVTYWSYRSIVGKVLGASRGVSQVAGWIGPCNFSPDLKRTECVKVKQSTPPEFKVVKLDVLTMKERTEPLGPADEQYPVDDFELVMPETEEVTNDIRVQKLSFVPVKDQATSRQGEGAPLWWDASIIFACGGESRSFRLRYDVDFVSAYPCHQGPHVLFYDYSYRAIRVDDGLMEIVDWGRRPARASTNQGSGSSSRDSSKTTLLTQTEPANTYLECVLVVEALGVSDNEVLARAWCAHNGHSAIIANIKKTCMACAIREAYAACIGIVILTEGGKPGERDEA
ncbi:hypothetical protein IWX49DRAFT_575724 [Phyllosticta citricarpa]|uniref:Uncharacterized protein n=1 Tax=Phyllosticta citricarpa TaxID=55181 RepID=A0ABR1MNM6_9PEZI